MGSSVNKKKWVRTNAGGAEAGAGVVASLPDVPFCGWIRRSRMVGPIGASLTLTISETSAGTGSFDLVLVYGATATPIDEEEDPGIFYEVPRDTGGNPQVGTLFISATSTVNGPVSFQFDIEPAV